jgi:uncharacterized tellurite resistance protein B-like protein
MSIDGVIAESEVQTVRHIIQAEGVSSETSSEELILNMLDELKQKGKSFSTKVISQIKNSDMTKEQCLDLLKHVIAIITADDDIDYREVRFFKTIRQCFVDKLSNDDILEAMPDLDKSFLLADVNDVM